MAFQVLFLCTGNSARSILSEATLNHFGRPRFVGYSGGSKPAGVVHPQTLKQLTVSGISTDGLYSKNFELYARDGAPSFDAVITLCDSAQLDPCPVFLGDFVRAHWGLPDPASVHGSSEIAAAFASMHAVITARIRELVDLRVETLDRQALSRELGRIACEHPVSTPSVLA